MTSRLRHAFRTTIVVAALAASLAMAAPAAGASGCGRAVLDDWSDGRIDKQYPFRCYDEAIAMLPRDLRDYSSAEEDMLRALQAARRGQPAPPNRDGGPGLAEPPPPPSTAPPRATGSDTPTTSETETTATPPGTGDEGGPEASPPADPESASSVPIPLLILAGLALLLVAGGSAGYLIRRLQARHIPPTG